MARERSIDFGGRPLLIAGLALLALIVLSAWAASAAHPADQDAHNGGTGTGKWVGNWTVAAGESLAYANQTIDLDGNLSVEGRLVLRNVTLVLHGLSNSRQQVRVAQGGELVATDWDDDPATVRDWSVIKANNTEFGFYFKVLELSKLTLRNMRIEGCGEMFQVEGYIVGLYLATEDATIENVDISRGFGGIFIDGVSPTIKGAKVHDNDWAGVYVVKETAKPFLEGCTIERNGREGVVVKDSADVTMRGCKVNNNLRGVVVENSYLLAVDCQIKDSSGPDLNLPHNSQADLINCTLTTTPSKIPVLLENSSLTSTNGNFDGKRVSMWFSIFRYQHFLTVVARWSDSRQTPIAGASVVVQDAEGRLLEYITGADGKAAFLALEVIEYDRTGPTWRNITYNPYRVTVTWNPVDKEQTVEMRYSGATATFTFDDTRDPVAVAPADMQVETGVNVTLDGTRCSDNVAIAEWNWSFEERGVTTYVSGERATLAFKEAKVYTVTLKVTDTSGRSGPGSVATFTVTSVDHTPPHAVAGPNVQVSQGATVHLDGGNSTDNVAIVSYTWSFTYDGAPRSLTGVGVDYTFNLPGVYTVVLTVEDAVGLSDSASKAITVMDTSAPTTTGSPDPVPPANRLYTVVVQVFFTVSGERPGDYTTYFRVNGGQWSTFTGSLAFGDGLALGDGTYRIDYYSQDGAGNKEATRSIDAFTVDATAPTFSEMDPPTTPYTTKEPTHVIKGRTEVGASLTINGAAVTVGPDGRFSLNATLEKGENSFTIIAKDPAGHQTDKTVVIDYEKVEPQEVPAGTNWLIVGAAIAAVVIVLLLVVYVMMTRKK